MDELDAFLKALQVVEFLVIPIWFHDGVRVEMLGESEAPMLVGHFQYAPLLELSDRVLGSQVAAIPVDHVVAKGVCGHLFGTVLVVFEKLGGAEQEIFVRVHPFDELLLDGEIVGVVDEQAQCGLAVPAGSPDFLVVSLDGAGDLRMDDVTDVRFVDSHSKCVRGAEY